MPAEFAQRHSMLNRQQLSEPRLAVSVGGAEIDPFEHQEGQIIFAADRQHFRNSSGFGQSQLSESGRFCLKHRQ